MKTVLYLIAWLACASLACAQSVTAVRGKVLDPNNKGVAGAPVQIKNAAGADFRAVTNSRGEYEISKVPAGTYEVSSAVPGFGFKRFAETNVAIPAGREFRFDVHLKESVGLSTIGDDPFTYNSNLRVQAENLTGHAPRTAWGKPDLNGVWNAKGDLFPEEPAVLPWAKEEFERRAANNFKDSPAAYCMPDNLLYDGPFLHRFVQTSDFLAVLSEDDVGKFRQIYLDGRPHPKDLNPTWGGHSVGRWEGDTLVVDVVGFHNRSWIGGYPHSEKLHMVERYRRIDRGHLEVKIVAEDPDTFTKPWHINMVWDLAPKEEVLETVCTENNRDIPHYTETSLTAK